MPSSMMESQKDYVKEKEDGDTKRTKEKKVYKKAVGNKKMWRRGLADDDDDDT